MKKIIKSVTCLLVVPCIAAAVFAGAQQVAAMPRTYFSQADEFRYTIQQESNGSVYVTVSPTAHDLEAKQKHAEHARLRTQGLASTQAVVSELQESLPADAPSKMVQNLQSIPVQITFARPIPLIDAQSLVKETGMQVESFAVAGRTGKGERLNSIYFGDLNTPIVLGQMHDADGQLEDLSKLNITDVIVIKGRVPPKMLKRIANDQRIYLADTSEFHIQNLLATQHAETIAGREVNIVVETPFWDLGW